VATFTCPVTFDVPAVLPGKPNLGNQLFKYFKNRKRYVAVYLLSDGSFVQDVEHGFAPDGSTIANINTSLPLPWDPGNPRGPYVTTYVTDPTDNIIGQVSITTSHIPYIVKLYQGASTVTAAEATALTAAGYGACIS
jgi:hypothetical protein